MLSIRDQIMSVVKAAVKQAAAGFPKATDKEQERRAEICSTCPSLRKEEYRCGECGCYLKWKISMGTQKCPLNKWEKEKNSENKDFQ